MQVSKPYTIQHYYAEPEYTKIVNRHSLATFHHRLRYRKGFPHWESVLPVGTEAKIAVR